MTEEEFFRKNYPDSCYGDKPLSPHWDFFQDGVEFGERQSEKKIEELEAQLEREKKEEMEEVSSALAYQRTVGVDNRIAELEEKLANADYQLEGRDLEIKELEEKINGVEFINKQLNEQLIQKSDTNHQLIEQIAELNERCSELKAQLEREKNLNQCMSDHNEQLRELIEKIKQCGNCGNRTIGNCEYCKRKPNQILADTLTSDYWKLKEIKENA